VKQKPKFQKKTQQHQIRPTFARPWNTPGPRRLNSLNSGRTQSGDIVHAIDEFVDWVLFGNRALGFKQDRGLAVIARISNPVNSALAQSICVLAPSAALACEAADWRP